MSVAGWLVTTSAVIFLPNGVDNIIWFVFRLLIPSSQCGMKKVATELVAVKGSAEWMWILDLIMGIGVDEGSGCSKHGLYELASFSFEPRRPISAGSTDDSPHQYR
uniref:Uncharacterized protein n=1 Tax=Oryza punctata TaxID=4537 RepID=A0A0E0JLS1_ORYPU